MEENQSDLALPDITEAEQLTSNEVEQEHENGDQGSTTTTRLVATSESSGGGGNVISVPVTLPLSAGSLIGTAFNVASLDHLPHFKPMICVDNNGYISGSAVVSDVGGDIKATHIVIQQQPQHEQIQTKQEIQTMTEPMQTNHNQNWTDTMNMEILPIRCKTTTAELYKSRLGSGGRGRCIKHKDQWFTPSEFENLCGRGSSKDWKRSIRYGGRSLQALIDEGVLTPHATSCTCAACCDDDSTATGPVRLFTPYKRRRRNQIEQTIKADKKKQRNIMQSEEDCESDHNNIVTKEETWQSLADGIVSGAEYLEQSTQIISEGNIPLDRLKTLCAQMVKATNEFRRCINEAKECHLRQIERIQRERDAALLAARVHTEIDDPNGVNQLQGEVELATVKKCANCNRDAMAECSLCRKTPYCSTFCQRKDWQSHQGVCRTSSESTQQIMFLVDDQGQ